MKNSRWHCSEEGTYANNHAVSSHEFATDHKLRPADCSGNTIYVVPRTKSEQGILFRPSKYHVLSRALSCWWKYGKKGLKLHKINSTSSHGPSTKQFSLLHAKFDRLLECLRKERCGTWAKKHYIYTARYGKSDYLASATEALFFVTLLSSAQPCSSSTCWHWKPGKMHWVTNLLNKFVKSVFLAKTLRYGWKTFVRTSSIKTFSEKSSTHFPVNSTCC